MLSTSTQAPGSHPPQRLSCQLCLHTSPGSSCQPILVARDWRDRETPTEQGRERRRGEAGQRPGQRVGAARKGQRREAEQGRLGREEPANLGRESRFICPSEAKPTPSNPGSNEKPKRRKRGLFHTILRSRGKGGLECAPEEALSLCRVSRVSGPGRWEGRKMHLLSTRAAQIYTDGHALTQTDTYMHTEMCPDTCTSKHRHPHRHRCKHTPFRG